jgi:uncharacterized membrane protein YkoI
MATYSNLYVDKGSTFNITIDVEKNTGNEIDLTDYTARGQIRKSYTSTTATDFTISIDIANGELDVSLTATETNALQAGRYVYDIEIEDNSSPAEVTRVQEGQVIVSPRVTSSS